MKVQYYLKDSQDAPPMPIWIEPELWGRPGRSTLGFIQGYVILTSLFGYGLESINRMHKIHLALREKSYDIQIGMGLLQKIPHRLREAGAPASLIIISSPAILSLHGASLLKLLENAGFKVESLSIPEGESHKNLQTVENILTGLVQLKANRKSWLVALGGGVVGDITGFAAAIFLRGIEYAQIPTTFLAQIDSSIGGKTGVNLQAGKNLVGAFHQPRSVLIDPSLLSTLPPREFNSGLFEAIKYGILQNTELFDLLESRHSDLPGKDPLLLEKIIHDCAAIKAEVVSRDEKEGRLRMILNLGHTLGHALEAATHYSYLTHGEAVGHGMNLAADLARRLGMLKESDAQRIEKAIRDLAPLPTIDFLTLDAILQPMQADKKFSGQNLRMVLPVGIGKVEIVDDTPKAAVEAAVREYLDREKRMN